MLVTWEFSSTLKAFLIKIFNELKEEKEQRLENAFTCFQSGKMKASEPRFSALLFFMGSTSEFVLGV